MPSEQLADLRALVGDMDAGRVELLLIIGGEPGLHRARGSEVRRRAEQGGAARRTRASTTTRPPRCATGTCPRRTSSRRGATCAPIDGTVSIVQPLIAPLYGGKSAHEVVAALAERPERAGYDIVRDVLDEAAAGRRRRGRVREGVAPLAARRRRGRHGVRAEGRDAGGRLRRRARRRPRRSPGLEVDFRRDPTVYDGRFANNGWLQELPKPMTKLTWDNAALIAPATAERLGVETGDVVELRHERAARCACPVWIVAGPGGRRADAAPRLRPHARGPRRQRDRVQRQRAARHRRARGTALPRPR